MKLSLNGKAALIINEIACNRYSAAATMLVRIAQPDRVAVALLVQKGAEGTGFQAFDRAVRGLERQDDDV